MAETPIRRPVDVARRLMACGLSLRDAHRALDQIAGEGVTRILVWQDDMADLRPSLAALGVEIGTVET